MTSVQERWYLHEHGLVDSPMGNPLGYHITNREADDESVADDPGYRLIVWEQITKEEGERIVACQNFLHPFPTEELPRIKALLASSFLQKMETEKVIAELVRLLASVLPLAEKQVSRELSSGAIGVTEQMAMVELARGLIDSLKR